MIAAASDSAGPAAVPPGRPRLAVRPGRPGTPSTKEQL